MWRRGRPGARLMLLLALDGLLIALVTPKILAPATYSLVEAVRRLGPISGWRCAQNAPYIYDPRRDSPDDSLLADAPEQLLWEQIPGLQVERVEADLRGGDTVVWTRLVAEDDNSAERRVYVLSPGRLQTIGIGLEAGWTTICNSHLGDWHIVAEHGLEGRPKPPREGTSPPL